ncbi:MAG: sensor histidine kinase [Acidobacteria bacterium]|nr:sensor histidine kinase [Acidobacteriota bacterium]
MWLNVAAYATWLVVATPTIAKIATGAFGGWPAGVWTMAFAGFGVALRVSLGRESALRDCSRRFVVGALASQAVAGVMMIALSRDPTMAATLVIVAAEAAAAFSPAVTWAWVAVQSGVLAVLWVAQFDTGIGALALAGSFAGFQAFAIAAMSLARSERAAREELARAVAELAATQALLAENSRTAERLRIARDLHDTLGHHLTALSLQLDVASRLTPDPAAEHVHEAHAITKLLLSDVRDVVSRMRETSRIDLVQMMRTLAAGTRALQVHLDVPDVLPIEETAQARALLQCVQEIITNAARHGGARNLWIRIEARPDGIDLHARDDGRGATEVRWGHGLTGMRERFTELSGRIDVTPGPGRGFEVHGFIPRPEAATS